MFFLGIAAGMLNVYRAVTGVRTAVGLRPISDVTGKRPQTGDWDDEE
jgi:hypothetical protein